MTILKYFDENGKLLQKKNERLNADNLALYIEQHGKEKAAGYIEALQDVLIELDENVMHFKSEHQQICTSSLAKIRRGITNFIAAQEAFLSSDAVKESIQDTPTI
ncbi:MAG: hypothetical protein JST70_01920 [Bacteroidetes bacterium]|nr:hypothetical protein [Bacteroidota bacterium]